MSTHSTATLLTLIEGVASDRWVVLPNGTIRHADTLQCPVCAACSLLDPTWTGTITAFVGAKTVLGYEDMDMGTINKLVQAADIPTSTPLRTRLMRALGMIE